MTDQIEYGLWRNPNRITTWPIYRFCLRRNQNLTVETNLTKCGLWWKADKTMMWPNMKVWSTLKTTLNSDWSNQVLSMMKIRQDNDVTDHTSVCSLHRKWIELSKPIGSVPSMRKIRQDNDMTYHIGAVYAQNNTDLPWSIWSSVDYD